MGNYIGVDRNFIGTGSLRYCYVIGRRSGLDRGCPIYGVPPFCGSMCGSAEVRLWRSAGGPSGLPAIRRRPGPGRLLAIRTKSWFWCLVFVVNPFEVIMGVGNASVCSVFVSGVIWPLAWRLKLKKNPPRHGTELTQPQLTRGDLASANRNRVPGSDCIGAEHQAPRTPPSCELDGPYFAQSAPLSHLTKADR